MISCTPACSCTDTRYGRHLGDEVDDDDGRRGRREWGQEDNLYYIQFSTVQYYCNANFRKGQGQARQDKTRKKER